jgi:hypothetical protein
MTYDESFTESMCPIFQNARKDMLPVYEYLLENLVEEKKTRLML